MRVLVTGATGLIGSAVVACLVQGGHDIVGVSRSIGLAKRREPTVKWVALDISRHSPRTIGAGTCTASKPW